MTLKRWQQVISLLGIMLFSATAAVATEKIALIQFVDIIGQLQDKESVRQLRSQLSAGASELRLMEQRAAEKFKKLQRDAPTMQRGEREKLEKEAADFQEQFTSKVRTFEQQSRQQQAEMHETLLKEVQLAAQQVAKRRGYTVVLDASVVFYVDTINDITKEVVEALKK